MKVFSFGSLPLKTHLPNGDVDLTTVNSFQNIEDKLENDVCIVLKGEEHNNIIEFTVIQVQYIHVVFKLMKCLFENIVVDISFNQLGGLCTFGFLGKVK